MDLARSVARRGTKPIQESLTTSVVAKVAAATSVACAIGRPDGRFSGVSEGQCLIVYLSAVWKRVRAQVSKLWTLGRSSGVVAS